MDIEWLSIFGEGSIDVNEKAKYFPFGPGNVTKNHFPCLDGFTLFLNLPNLESIKHESDEDNFWDPQKALYNPFEQDALKESKQ